MAALPNDGSSTAETAQELKSLLHQLRKSSRQRKKRGGVSASDDREDARRLDKLRKIFARLIEQHEFDYSSTGNGSTGNEIDGNNSARYQWKNWLATQHDAFILHLIGGVVSGKTTALRTFCGVLASSPVNIVGLSSKDKEIQLKSDESTYKMLSERLLNKLLEACVKSRQSIDIAVDEDSTKNAFSSSNKKRNVCIEEEEGSGDLVMDECMLTLLESEFIRPHRDVQYFVHKGVHQIALDLLSSLDRVKKGVSSNIRGGVGKVDGKGNEKEAKNGCVDGDRFAIAERNVGIVAENMCRLLMMVDYVPKQQIDLMDETEFLFPPPIILSGDNSEGDKDSEDGDKYGRAIIGDDSEEDDNSSDASDTSEDEEEAMISKKRKKQTPGRSNKRLKKTKLIAWQQTYKHRHAHQEAWLSVLRLPSLPPRTQRRVLQHLSTYVLNICPSPLRFAEYFTKSFQGGRSTTQAGSSSNSLAAILSLHGLFILMLDHQLEYPQFYNSLYTLLHPRILYTKHRARFLRLLSQALLSNSMLPAYVVGSFCKKMCRLALNGPPSGGLFVLALASNLLRKHGECACLIHRKGVAMEDVFVEEVDDLVKTRVLESSLWELVALEQHYHPAISTLAKSVGTEDDKTTPMHDMEDFMVHSYKSLFEQEKKRLGGGSGGNVDNHLGGGKKRKGGGGKVSLTFVEPESLFTNDDVFGEFFQS